MKSPRRALALGVSALALVPAPCRAAAPGPRPAQVQMDHPAQTRIVLTALNGAYRKLQRAECQRLLDDFRDAEGRTLRESLEPLGIGPAEYLSLITYRDGRHLASGRCQRGSAAAVTHTGHRVVFVCLGSFSQQSVGIRGNTVIHEMLHSLGLGEDPPTSKDINAQVIRRCGT